MSEVLKHEIATISLWHMGAIIIILFAMTILYLKANKSVALEAFLKVAIAILIWMVGKMLKTVAFDVDLRWACIVLYYGGICYLEVAFLEFGYAYYSGKKLPRKLTLIARTVAFFQFLLILTNPFHFLFYAHYDFKGDSFGPLFYLHVLIEYVYIITGIVFCGIRFSKKLRHLVRGFKFIVGIAIVTPIILNLIYISKLLKFAFRFFHIQFSFDITPLVFTWSLLLFVYVTFKYEFFELSPIMRHEIIDRITTPLSILNQSQRLVYKNQALDNLSTSSLYQSVKELIARSEENVMDLLDVFEETTWVKGKCYKIFVRKVQDYNGLFYVTTFNDISSYRELENSLMTKKEELDRANKQLELTIDALKEMSKSGARNYVARELHDIIGHSLVVTIKLLEVAELYRVKNPVMSRQAMKDAIVSVEAGMEEMHAVSQNNETSLIYNDQSLEEELKRLLAYVKSTGLETSLQFRGSLHKIDEHVFDAVKKVCTELVTNTLKHSSGSHLLLSVVIQDEVMQIHVLDDGIGCESLVFGNGLSGIKDRLGLIGGKIRFVTEPEEGFASYMDIPIG